MCILSDSNTPLLILHKAIINGELVLGNKDMHKWFVFTVCDHSVGITRTSWGSIVSLFLIEHVCKKMATIWKRFIKQVYSTNETALLWKYITKVWRSNIEPHASGSTFLYSKLIVSCMVLCDMVSTERHIDLLISCLGQVSTGGWGRK